VRLAPKVVMRIDGDFVDVILHLVPRLRMSGTVLLFPFFLYMPSLLAQGQLYLHLCSTDEMQSLRAYKFLFLHYFIFQFVPCYVEICFKVFYLYYIRVIIIVACQLLFRS
jgi:hypothetical protein